MSEVKTKEPLIRIIKRDRSSFGYKVWVRAAAIILALVVDAIFIYSVTGLNPLSVYGVMLNGTFMTSIRFSWAMRDLVTLLCIGIALAPAFKTALWNIGARRSGACRRSCDSYDYGKIRRKPSYTGAFSGNVSYKCDRGGLWGLFRQYLKHIGIPTRLFSP